MTMSNYTGTDTFTLESVVRDDYRPSPYPSFYPTGWREVPIMDPANEQRCIGFAEAFAYDAERPDWYRRPADGDKEGRKTLLATRYPEPPELHDYEPGTARAVMYGVISERSSGEVIGLVEFIPPGVERPKRPAPYAGVPILAVLSW